MGFSGLHRCFLLGKVAHQKQKPPGRGARLSVDRGPCLNKHRHPTAQAERTRWRPHLEALQIGCSMYRRSLLVFNRARGPTPYSIARLRREAAPAMSPFTIEMRSVNVKGQDKMIAYCSHLFNAAYCKRGLPSRVSIRTALSCLSRTIVSKCTSDVSGQISQVND